MRLIHKIDLISEDIFKHWCPTFVLVFGESSGKLAFSGTESLCKQEEPFQGKWSPVHGPVHLQYFKIVIINRHSWVYTNVFHIKGHFNITSDGYIYFLCNWTLGTSVICSACVCVCFLLPLHSSGGWFQKCIFQEKGFFWCFVVNGALLLLMCGSWGFNEAIFFWKAVRQHKLNPIIEETRPNGFG